MKLGWRGRDAAPLGGGGGVFSEVSSCQASASKHLQTVLGSQPPKNNLVANGIGKHLLHLHVQQIIKIGPSGKRIGKVETQCKPRKEIFVVYSCMAPYGGNSGDQSGWNLCPASRKSWHSCKSDLCAMALRPSLAQGIHNMFERRVGLKHQGIAVHRLLSLGQNDPYCLSYFQHT